MNYDFNSRKHLSIIIGISLIAIMGLSIGDSVQSSIVPEWIKNNAKWWSEGSISEADYITSLEYLISNGIINIPIPFAEVAAAQTQLSEEERAQYFSVTFHDGLIDRPFTVDTFSKFEATSSNAISSDETLSLSALPIYTFKDTPAFLLEGLPSADKQLMYEGIDRWMRGSTNVTPFDVDVDVVAGDGSVIVTWEFRNCQPVAFGTYLQDLIFFYQFVDQDRPEIRDRALFDCTGVHLVIP